ncbi:MULTISPECIES: hypothetical protein [unclassified Streptomyces]|uniref:hypothetical protein n=1 Tax=unclassified Streptomyces TaxID=2593676 RepID=UPI0021C9EDFF|nr:hypothetical protein [Streptomyces sp. FIT100]UUN29865.1 hypothetical protein KK483_28410 [Streptomyces sp. FIT100]
MPHRQTRGIVTDYGTSNPGIEADAIMTAAVLGLATWHIKNQVPIRFDMDPRDKDKEWEPFKEVVQRLNSASVGYLSRNNLLLPGTVDAGFAPLYTKGAVIVGVYHLAGQKTPDSVNEPVLSPQGKVLYEKIRNEQLPQYVGRGAYTGFVDNWNSTGDTDPVGPLSTVRFLAPKPDVLHETPILCPRWLPPISSALWGLRLRRNTQDSHVPWGMIGGDKAQNLPNTGLSNPTNALNEADQVTGLMKAQGMVFEGEPALTDIVGYTHGMIQAIYKAYALGPSTTPYEITVGTETTKLASCVPCSLFMIALGYPPTSIHLGRGESWVPLFEPYTPGRSSESVERAVIRDLNNSWQAACAEWLSLGLKVLDQAAVTDDHQASVAAVRTYLDANSRDKTVASLLILDAVTIHDSEMSRISRTLKPADSVELIDPTRQ